MPPAVAASSSIDDIMLLSAIVCLGGGILALGSTFYSSYNLNIGRQSKQCEGIYDAEDNMKKGVGVWRGSEGCEFEATPN